MRGAEFARTACSEREPSLALGMPACASAAARSSSKNHEWVANERDVVPRLCDMMSPWSRGGRGGWSWPLG